MATLTATPKPTDLLSEDTIEFYRQAMRALESGGVPFLVGGAYAFARYTGIERHTKDFDVFVKPEDFDRALEVLGRQGWKTERTFEHWLGKAYHGDDFVDVIFSSGNGVARVDDLWFEHAVEGEVLEMPVKLIPAEEMIWSKSLIMERERFDGGDVNHILHARMDEIDWDRLLRRFDDDGAWRVLLAHLSLFGFVYPGEATRIPYAVIGILTQRLRRGTAEAGAEDEKLCRGTILSRSQYLIDIHAWGYEDARLEPKGNMTAEEIQKWTAAAEEDGDTTQFQHLEGAEA
ncbi:MAG TPA: nucleotidyltransferase family protein [Thermoanaerobaculia bacterium]